MAITSMNKIFAVDDEEYGFSFETQPFNAESLKMVIPKTTGSLSGTKQDSNAADRIFDNDPACKPSFAKKVNRGEYVTVPIDPSGNWIVRIIEGGKIAKDSRFSIHFLNGDIQRQFVTPTEPSRR